MASVDSWLNFQLICKPEQSGKTFIMIQQIIRDIAAPIEGKIMINIILCDNNLLLTKQTSQRVNTELNEFVDEGVTYVELSSHIRAACHDKKSAFYAIVEEGVRNIVCCTNGKRMDDIYDLVTSINENPLFKDKFHTTIWLDEADKFIGFIDSTFIALTRKFEMVHVKLITATPDDLFKRYEYMNVLPLESTTSEQYHGWEDNQIKIYPCKECIEFSKTILTEIAQDEVVPGSIWFIPALSVKSSHKKMTELCLSVNMAVMCVNGNGIVLTIPGMSEAITIEKDAEINETILKLYRCYHLESFAFAITGNICIGRGISIMSEHFMIDHAILSHFASKSEASQIAGRMKGNIKHYNGYKEKGITVYTTDEFHKIAVDWEKKSRYLAELAYMKEQDGRGTVIDKNEYNTCEKPFVYICHDELFTTLTKAKTFLKTRQRDLDITNEDINDKSETTEDKAEINSSDTPSDTHVCGPICKKNLPMHWCDGYFVTSKLLKQGKRVADLLASDRLTLETANAIDYGRCISSTKKGSKFLILPVYESLSTPGKHVKFQIRYLQPKEQKK